MTPGGPRDARGALLAALARHRPSDGPEAEAVERIRAFVRRHPDPFDRRIPEGHLTGSALVLSVDGAGVLLLRHRRLDRWLQPGGHAEPGEQDGASVALREAREETGLADIRLHPTAPRPLDVDVHVIPARPGEPAHEHLDLRYLVVAAPARPRPAGGETAALRWFGWEELGPLDLDPGLRRALATARAHLARHAVAPGSRP